MRLENIPKGIPASNDMYPVTDGQTKRTKNIPEKLFMEHIKTYLGVSSSGLSFKFKASENATPLNNEFTVDNETYLSVTSLSLSITSDSGLNVTSFLETIKSIINDNPVYLRVLQKSDITNFFTFRITDVNKHISKPSYKLSVDVLQSQFNGILSHGFVYEFVFETRTKGGDSLTVNGKTVEENVPENALFTDTQNTQSDDISTDSSTISATTKGVKSAIEELSFITEYDNFTLLTANAGGKGEKTSTIYITKDDNSQYRWDGTNYIKLNSTTSNGFTDITWESLLALTTREAGQKYNITGSQDTTKDYGKITLDNANQFTLYFDTFNQIITIE